MFSLLVFLEILNTCFFFLIIVCIYVCLMVGLKNIYRDRLNQSYQSCFTIPPRRTMPRRRLTNVAQQANPEVTASTVIPHSSQVIPESSQFIPRSSQYPRPGLTPDTSATEILEEDSDIDSGDGLQPPGTGVRHAPSAVGSLVRTSVSEPVITKKKVSE